MQTLTFAAVNFEANFGHITENLNRMETWVRKLAAQGAQVIGFPEMSVCGYDRSEAILPHLQRFPGPITDRLVAMAAEYQVSILAGLATRDQQGNRHLSQVAASTEGISALYHKIHLGPTERTLFTAGRDIALASYRGWQIGLQLCYDTHFPELSTLLALRGADVLFCGFASPRESPEAKCDRLERYLAARAYDNSCYLISCNLMGRGGSGQVFPGGALAFSPKGDLIAKACGSEQNYLLVDLDPTPLERIRSSKMGCFLPNRQPTLYKGLIDDNHQKTRKDRT